MINKDTIVCCSFAKTAGNTGCFMYNNAFEYLKLNYIYKSFSVSNIKDAIFSAKTLNFRGCSITMPFKIEALSSINVMSDEVKEIGATNTIVNDNSVLTAYNTDAYSSYTLLNRYNHFHEIYILGSGGFSKAVQYSSKKIFSKINLIDRKNWYIIDTIRNGLIFNCTPININVDLSNTYIDCNVNSKTGKELALLQASKQFELYTNIKFPMEYINSIKNNNIDNIKYE